MKTGTAPYQLISFVVDNSASCEREKFSALMGAFRRFAAAHAENESFAWELICYDAFEPSVAKSFDSAEISPVFLGRMPLLARATDKARERLLAKAAQLRAKGAVVHRPMLIVLSDGFTFDDAEELARSLDAMEREGKLTYLPFRLGSTLYTERMRAFDRVKHMIEIREGQIEGLLAFLDTLLVRRAELPVEQAMKLEKTDFEGWALL